MNPHHSAPEAGEAQADVLVAIAASAGGLQALRTILADLPANLPAAVAIVLHRPPSHRTLLAEILGRVTPLPVRTAHGGEIIHPSNVYVAPADRHLTIGADRRLALMDGRRIRHVRSSANPLFESAAQALGPNVIAVVLTGGDSDGTDGVQSVAAAGGSVIAQAPSSSEFPFMPRAAIATGAVHTVLPLEDVAREIVAEVRARSRKADE